MLQFLNEIVHVFQVQLKLQAGQGKHKDQYRNGTKELLCKKNKKKPVLGKSYS